MYILHKYFKKESKCAVKNLLIELKRAVGVIPGTAFFTNIFANNFWTQIWRGFFWPIIIKPVPNYRIWSIDSISGLKMPKKKFRKIFAIKKKFWVGVNFYPIFFWPIFVSGYIGHSPTFSPGSFCKICELGSNLEVGHGPGMFFKSICPKWT